MEEVIERSPEGPLVALFELTASRKLFYFKGSRSVRQTPETQATGYPIMHTYTHLAGW